MGGPPYCITTSTDTKYPDAKVLLVRIGTTSTRRPVHVIPAYTRPCYPCIYPSSIERRPLPMCGSWRPISVCGGATGAREGYTLCSPAQNNVSIRGGAAGAKHSHRCEWSTGKSLPPTSSTALLLQALENTRARCQSESEGAAPVPRVSSQFAAARASLFQKAEETARQEVRRM